MENVPAADRYHESDDDEEANAAAAAASADLDAAERKRTEKKEKLSLGAMAMSAMASKNARFADAVGDTNTTPGRPSVSASAAGNATPPNGTGGISARTMPTGTVAASYGAPPSTAPNA